MISFSRMCHGALMDDRPRHTKPVTDLAKAGRKESLSKPHIDLTVLGEKPMNPLSLFR